MLNYGFNTCSPSAVYQICDQIEASAAPRMLPESFYEVSKRARHKAKSNHKIAAIVQVVQIIQKPNRLFTRALRVGSIYYLFFKSLKKKFILINYRRH